MNLNLQMNIPEQLGKYEIKEQVGRGSMGIVYKGYDPFADRDVAVKVALSENLNDKESGNDTARCFLTRRTRREH